MKNRWAVLAAGVVIQTVLGGIYAWSTFVPWLIKEHGLSAGQCGFIFGLTIATFTLAMTVAGHVLAAKGPRITTSISAVLFALGYMIASLSDGSFLVLLLSLSGIVGTAIGFGYVCPLSVGMKWFPDKKGLVTGICVAGFGGGAILLASVAEYALLTGMSILTCFRWLGIAGGATLFAAALFLANPPSSGRTSSRHDGLSMVRSLPFGIISLGMFAGTFAGLLVIGNLTPLVTQAGLTEAQAVVCVSIFAVGNALGRILWGQLFDQLGYRSIPLSLGSFGLLTLLLLMPLPTPLLWIAVGLIGFGFGANFVIYASAISRFFGTTSFPRLYPICFLAYGLAGIIGPGIGGVLADLTGSYNMALCASATILGIAALVSAATLHAFTTPLPRPQPQP